MGVAEHHRIYAGQVVRDVLFIVDHIENEPVQRDGQVPGKTLRPLLVIVSADDIYGRESRHLVQDGLGVDVPGVEDGVGLLQVFQHLWPQQAVGVGENGKFHG